MRLRETFSLGIVLALAGSVTLPARAELLKNFKSMGSIESRSFSIDNETDRNATADDYRGETNVRMMFGATFDLLDDVHGGFLLDRTPEFGTGAPTITGGSGVLDTLTFDNGYVKIDKLMGAVDLTIGQQFYGDPSDLVIYYGPQNNDTLTVTSLSAFRADADLMGWGKFHGLVGKILDTDAVPAPPGPDSNADTNVWGGEINTDKVIPKGNAAVYYYTRQIKKAANVVAGNNTLADLGVRVGGDVLDTGLGYGAEYIQNLGRNNGIATAKAYDGSAYFLNLHYGRDINAMPARAHIEFGRGSDDFAAVAPGRRFGIIWGEHTSLALAPSNSTNRAQTGAGLSDLKVADAGVGVNPTAKLGVDLNWYRFMYDANTAASGIYAGGVSAGTEYDLIVSWKHSENVSLELNAATFQVGTSLQNTGGTPTSPITRLGADIKIKY